MRDEENFFGNLALKEVRQSALSFTSINRCGENRCVNRFTSDESPSGFNNL
ncbi:hypothetical protein WN51_06055 [Melipona quadrifasciata]|uniref:Uncharacterized protein n=1 Tax=Melipona quadrifasciata TaxID=166423 RepID=A0A0N0BBX0_9HYME|nr:hypothetical protein WN51_06055 [Melipona quadrifasciata]